MLDSAWLDWLRGQVEALGVGSALAPVLTYALAAAVVLAMGWLADRVMRFGLLRVVHFVAARTQATWDDALVEHGFFRRVARIAPAIVVYLWASAFGDAQVWVERLALVFMIFATLRAIDALADAAVTLYQQTEISLEKPIRGYVQVAQILLYLVGTILAIATLLDKEPWGLLTGLGALSAVLLLVFRDSILGFAASLQLASNDMVRRGDWIAMPSHNADGDVLDISLHTVKVQNWDKTITTIPTHALISESFTNWRGMSESGGRRIKRSLLIDISTIRFCDDEMLARYRRFSLLGDYLERKLAEVKRWNEEHGVDLEPRVNGRRLTNVGTFRAYVEAYLRDHPKIHKQMTFLVRHLAPTPDGLPIEIYVFSNDQDWARYEAIQADIFDHILAAVPEFDLRVAQRPTGHNLVTAAAALRAEVP